MEIKVFQNELFNNGNSYLLINDKKEAILIDLANKADEILEYIEKNNINLTTILITHGHFDHLVSIEKVLTKFNNLKLYIGKEDEVCLYDPEMNAGASRNNFWKLENKYKNTILIDKSISLNINDFNFDIYLMKGHTPGTVFYHLVDLNYMFCGDTLFKEKIGFHGKEMKRCNDDIFKKSIQFLYTNKFKDTTLFPGHHESNIKISEIKKINIIANEFIK
ncbi:MBL fold metallo-hydrolase [Spiroplasma tabanidicola]|uniref:Hydroxyacylglutathione hydrolase n=1 Tax=Spiroplasma tabanidicola TaxID=324079 RepID=A0A6I6C9C9_9MOLU|nr:MBL fold metallo-hydrolase [Spiroplasma tabanidicola]QGS52059.1 hydroxyacylglutathione hydrolase [Spiroplasma tabanidicola]